MFFFALCFGGMANKLAHLTARDSKGESPQDLLNVHTTVLRIWEWCGMVFPFPRLDGPHDGSC